MIISMNIQIKDRMKNETKVQSSYLSQVLHSQLLFLSPKKSVPYMHVISSPIWISRRALTHAVSRPVGTNWKERNCELRNDGLNVEGRWD